MSNKTEEKIIKLIEKYDFYKIEYTNKDIYTLKIAYSFNQEANTMFSQTEPLEKKQKILENCLDFLLNYDSLSKEQDWIKADNLENNYKSSILEVFFENNLFLKEDEDLKKEIITIFERNINYTHNLEQATAVVLYQLWMKNNIKNIILKEPPIYERYKDKGQFVKVKPCAKEYEGKTYLGLYLGDLPQSVAGKYKEDTYEINYSVTNPYIYIPEKNTFVWGSNSWWGHIKTEKDLEEIKDTDIENIWYVSLMNILNNSKEENNDNH